MKNSLIALMSDFGDKDFFVASIKGVILSTNPSARIIDITHNTPSFDVQAGAFILYATYKYFPAGTIFLSIVDPGVGSSRRILLVETQDYFFIAPDNGILTRVLEVEPVKKIMEITNPKFFLPQPSSTFEGRDKMAPAAAWLSKGVSAEEFGNEVNDFIKITVHKPRKIKNKIEGQILYIDRFGNGITNIPINMLRHFKRSCQSKVLSLQVRNIKISSFKKNYACVNKGESIFLEGSLGLIEVSAMEGSAAKKLGFKTGDKVIIQTAG
ncbi:MAG: SAM-dependent chlorinase/fluorinase [Candidatus Aminicenantes bacterium]|nr:SAM-dependent chlorinase/fluorinase [Candidatus Aminicenantes bacterium]